MLRTNRATASALACGRAWSSKCGPSSSTWDAAGSPSVRPLRPDRIKQPVAPRPQHQCRRSDRSQRTRDIGAHGFRRPASQHRRCHRHDGRLDPAHESRRTPSAQQEPGNHRGRQPGGCQAGQLREPTQHGHGSAREGRGQHQPGQSGRTEAATRIATGPEKDSPRSTKGSIRRQLAPDDLRELHIAERFGGGISNRSRLDPEALQFRAKFAVKGGGAVEAGQDHKLSHWTVRLHAQVAASGLQATAKSTW